MIRRQADVVSLLLSCPFSDLRRYGFCTIPDHTCSSSHPFSVKLRFVPFYLEYHKRVQRTRASLYAFGAFPLQEGLNRWHRAASDTEGAQNGTGRQWGKRCAALSPVARPPGYRCARRFRGRTRARPMWSERRFRWKAPFAERSDNRIRSEANGKKKLRRSLSGADRLHVGPTEAPASAASCLSLLGLVVLMGTIVRLKHDAGDSFR